MRSTQFVAAAAAFAGFAVAKTCTKDIKISEANQSIDCDIVDANISVDDSLEGAVTIEGPKEIKGDLIIKDATGLISIASSTINAIGGRFELNGLEKLNMLNMPALESVKELSIEKLTSLSDLTFGTEGLNKAEKVSVSDTDLANLGGFMFTTIKELKINNNPRLLKYDSALVNVTTLLEINNNGRDMEIDLPDLETASEVQIANVKSIKVPKLEKVGASLKFDKCAVESISAPNLTEITNALAFINNDKLSNVTFPKLTSIGGDLRIVNNTELTELNGFPELESAASINFGGNFEEIDMPKLNKVSGVAEASTTSTKEDFCKFFEQAKDDDVIRAGSDCTYDNEDANEGGETEGGQRTDSSGKSGSNKDNDDAAGIIGVNTALMGLALIAGVAQLL